MKKATFETELIAGHKGVIALLVPFDPVAVWKRDPIAIDERREGWLVQGTVNGAKFYGWIGFRWGRYFVIVDEELQANAGVAAGDLVKVALEPTDSPRAMAKAQEQAPRTTAPKRKKKQSA